MTTITTQIRARLDAIAAERANLDDEQRRLMKALEALEPTTPLETSDTPGLRRVQPQPYEVAARMLGIGLNESDYLNREERLNRPG